MKKALLLAVILVLAFSTVCMAKGYPKRDITNVVVWGAGGGTDTCNRIISAEMAPILGVNINVINKPGGVAGSVGMNYAFKRKVRWLHPVRPERVLCDRRCAGRLEPCA
jgi:tripartite-type tricarboxylate transporter receptor subunit TctC